MVEKKKNKGRKKERAQYTDRHTDNPSFAGPSQWPQDSEGSCPPTRAPGELPSPQLRAQHPLPNIFLRDESCLWTKNKVMQPGSL